MTKIKREVKRIDSVLQEQCRRLFLRKDKEKMAVDLKVSINLITSTINGDRYNQTVIDALQEWVVIKVAEIQKQLEIYNDHSK